MISIGFLSDKLTSLPFHTIKPLIPKLIREENAVCGEISIVICSDEELKELNHKHLQHDYYTDIITFDFNTPSETNGELYISYDRIKENAATYQVTVLEEYTRVCFHGVLHLLGYKDKKVSDKKTMRAKEDYYLSKLFHVKHA